MPIKAGVPDGHREHGPQYIGRILDSGLGQRDGICSLGWPHEFDAVACELDSVLEEDINGNDETHHEALSKMRAHAHQGVPSKWDLLRAHADTTHPARAALDQGHGSALTPLTTADAPAAAPAPAAGGK